LKAEEEKIRESTKSNSANSIVYPAPWEELPTDENDEITKIIKGQILLLSLTNNLVKKKKDRKVIDLQFRSF
jgi:hypothetical protein